MEQLHPRPVPLPRSKSPAGQNPMYENHQLKKPVPLPRSTAIAMASPSKVTEEDKDSNNSTGSSFEDVFTKGYNTLTKSLKNKFKSASENVQGKGKAVIETTKSVGLKTERSVKGILQKRQSLAQNVDSKTDATNPDCPKLDRCQSLPSDNIFNSITFNSPIPHLDDVVDAEDDRHSLPPPEYPPPPLPDESLYDELSVRSSHSGSHGDYYTCPSIISSLPDIESSGLDEDIPHLSSFAGSSTNSSFTEEIMCMLNTERENGDVGKNYDKRDDTFNKQEIKPNRFEVSRSESWSFYDTVFLPKTQKQEDSVCVVVQEGSTSRDSQSKDNLNSQYVNVVTCGNKKSSISHGIENEQYVNVTINEQGSKKQTNLLKAEQKSVALKPLQPLKLDNNSNDPDNQHYQARRQDSFASTADSECSSLSVPNELYINWQPQILSKTQDHLNDNLSITNNFKNNLFISKKFFSEFDPLCDNKMSCTENQARNRHSTSESLPVFNNEDNINEFNDDFDTVSLPVPPKRFDSITPDSSEKPDIPNDVEYVLYQRPMNSTAKHISAEKKQNQEDSQDDSSTSQNSLSESPERAPSPGKRKSNLVRWTSMKRAMKKLADGSSWSPGVMRRSPRTKEDRVPTPEAVEKPNISLNTAPLHSGSIYKSTSSGDKYKDFVKKNCQLGEGRLLFTSEQNGSNKDVIMLEHIYSIFIVRETKQSNDGEDLYCFEISCSQQDKPRHILGCNCTTDRRIWMQRLLESLTQVFPIKLSSDYERAGWCFIKEGISGNWIAAWILLHKRTLFFHPCKGKLSEIDLRKARLIILQESEEGCARVAEKGPVLRIDGPNCAFYLQMNQSRETKAWHRAVREAAVNNGPNLHDQQLTKDDLPTIIDKCINFVYTHGSMSEGIYRRSGSNTNVLKLHTAFQKDAWAVQITKNDYSEHDVASVLKRFFRELPEPLLTRELHLVLCNAAALGCSEHEKVSLYRSQLEKLPPVNYVTTRRLMGHLHHVSQQCERNLMPVDNLAAIWGPTLMHVDVALQKTGMDPNWSRSESQVVADLISLYPRLFDVGGAELAREQRMHEVLERYHNSVQQTPHTTKPSGDIKVWVYIGSKDSDPVGVTVSPQREALDVCNELSPHMSVYGHELCLLESVLSGALIRPLHHTERVLDTVLRWGYWDDADCKDNCLILVINTILRDLAPLAKPPIAQCGELRFADLKSKNFKVYLFEFSQAKLCYYKDKTGSIKLGEWKIEDIVWYIGHEPKRNPHTRWSLTFINKNGRSKRSKDSPFFGYTIAGTTRDEQLRWMAAMMVGEYPHVELLPKPQLNLLE